MVINVLAIGDTGNIISTMKKFTKNVRIHLINFPKDGAGSFTYDDVETFENYKVKFSKVYTTHEEETYRYAAYLKNLKKIKEEYLKLKNDIKL